MFSVSFSFGAWGIYSAFSDGTFSALLNLTDYVPQQVTACLVLLGLMVAIFLSGFAIFVCLMLSFISIQKTSKIMKRISAFGIALCLVAAGVSLAMPYIMGKGGFLTAQAGFGAFGCTLVLLVMWYLNHLLLRKIFRLPSKKSVLKRSSFNKR